MNTPAKLLTAIGLSLPLLFTTVTVQAKTAPISKKSTPVNTQKASKAESDDERMEIIKDFVNKVEDIYGFYKENGMSGLKTLSEECYKRDSSSVNCVYVDVTAHLIDQRFVEAFNKQGGNAKPSAYFTKRTVDARTAKLYYQPLNVSAKEQQEHWEAMVEIATAVLNKLESD